MRQLGFLVLLCFLAVGCAASGAELEDDVVLTLPVLQTADLAGTKLRVVATTSIIGDVVAQVGGDAIELTVLMAAGQDPHGYEPAAGDLTAVADAHLIFVNGWQLEEGLLDDLANIAENGVVVPVSVGVTPLHVGEGAHHHDHGEEEAGAGGIDPHVWFDPANVKIWVATIETALKTADPANSSRYEQQAASYVDELDALITDIDSEIAAIPTEKRILVTNHDSMSYFANRYGFELLGTIIPAASTVAEPSASDLVDLVALLEAEGVCTLFAETTANEQLATAVAAELANCDTVQIISLYTGAIGPVGSGDDSYIGMMRSNVARIVAGLR